MSNARIIIWLIGFPIFAVAHAYLSVWVFGLAFGFGESGEPFPGAVFGILSLLLTPFLLMSELLLPFLPNWAFIPVGVTTSSLLWWFFCLGIARRFLRDRQAD